MPKKRARFFETRIFGFAIAAAVALVIAAVNYGTGMIRALESKVLDEHFSLKFTTSSSTQQEGTVFSQKSLKISDDIMIVGIDFNTLSNFGKWPFPRWRHADLINAFARIKDQTQRENALFLDVFFIDKDANPKDDDALLKSMRDSKRVYLETLLSHEADSSAFAEEMAAREEALYGRLGTITRIKGDWKVMDDYLSSQPPLPEYVKDTAGYGHANFSPDSDEVYRRQPLIARATTLVAEISSDELKPGFTVNESNFERLAWMDRSGRYHNIPVPITAAGLDSLKRTLVRDAPPKKVDSNEDGTIDSEYYVIRHFRDRFVPAITLSLALNYFGKTINDIDVVLGDHIRIPSPTRYDADSGTRVPYQIQVTPDEFDASGNLVKEGRKRDVPFIDIPIDLNGSMLVNFMGYPSIEGGAQTFPMRSYSGYASKAPASEDPTTWRRTFAAANKIIMVGAFTKGMAEDEKPTPMGLMYGIELHANALNTILMDNFIHPAPRWMDLAILAVLVFLVAFMSSRMSTVLSFFGTIVILAGFFVGVTTVFDTQSLLLNFSQPALAMVFTFMSIVVYRAMTEEREKKQIRETFGKYVSPEVAEELANNPPNLGGEDRMITVFFSDIRDFTGKSENMTSQELVNYLNRYLTAMSDTVMEYLGTVDKYIGDAVMGFWNAPLDQPDHALLACKCALRQLERLGELNATLPEEQRIDIGIGINTDKVTVANMGSQVRMSYTVIGDGVNLASRLEGTNKAYGTKIIMSEYTYGLVKDKVLARELDNIRVKGKNKPVLIYELIDVLEGLDAPVLPKGKRGSKKGRA
jgi:adenylate cyclase